MGVKCFFFVLIGGESFFEGSRGVKVDWCIVIWWFEFDEYVGVMVYDLLCGLIGGVFGEDVNGMFGYECGVCFYIFVNGMFVFVVCVDWGGVYYGGWVCFDISGFGCLKFGNWMCLCEWIE